MNKLNILIVGGGMYVSGRGTNTYGTVIPALLEGRKYGIIDKIAIATTNSNSAIKAKKILQKISSQMKIDKQCEYFPKNGRDRKSYIKAAKIFKPDAIIVSVPDHLHASISIPLMKLGLHCLIVKPMASTVREGKLMIKTAKENNIVAQVEFHKRLDESNLILRDKIKSNELGKLLYCVVEYSQQKRIPINIFKSWSSKSNVFQYLAVHYVDLIQYITGFKPIKLSSWGQKKYLIKKRINTWDSIQTVITWKNNKNDEFISTHMTNWIDPNHTSAISDQKITFVGTEGRFDSNQKNRGNQFVNDVTGINDINPYFTSLIKSNDNRIFFTGYGIKSIIQFIKDVQEYNSGKIKLKDLEKVRPSFKQAIISTAVNEAVIKSLKNNSKSIKIKY